MKAVIAEPPFSGTSQDKVMEFELALSLRRLGTFGTAAATMLTGVLYTPSPLSLIAETVN